MSVFPNLDPKQRGDRVETVHPCNVGRQGPGVVEGIDHLNGPDDWARTLLSVRVGPGSTVYGPAENWRVVA